MAGRGITYDDVAAAARDLHLNGSTPTIARVRSWLQRGSHSTIAPHLKTWTEAQKKAVDLDDAEGTQAVLADAVAPVLHALMAQARAQIETAHGEHAQQIDELTQRWQTAETALQSLKDEHRRLKASLKDTVEARDAAVNAQQAADKQALEMGHQRDLAQASFEQLSQYQHSLKAEIEAEREAWREERRQLVQDHQQVRTELKQAQQLALADAERRAGEEKQALQLALSEAQRHTQRIPELEQKLNDLDSDWRQLSIKVPTLEESLKGRDQQIAQLDQQVAHLQQQVEQERARNDALQRDHAQQMRALRDQYELTRSEKPPRKSP